MRAPLPAPPESTARPEALVSEEDLVKGLSRREPEVVGEFLASSWRAVRVAASRLTRDPDLAEDWTHDVLLRILEDVAEGRFEYRWPGCFWSWFRMRKQFLLLNLLSQHRREQARRVELDAREEPESFVLAAVAGREQEPTDARIERAEIRALVSKGLDMLTSERHRQAVEAHMIRGRSYQQISDEMGVPLNTVRTWIRRGRLGLKEQLAPAFPEVA